MSTSWIPLMDEALRDVASQHQQKIAPASWCVMTEKPQVARFIGHSEFNTPCYHAKATLRDASRQTWNEHSFILPSKVPTQSLELYSFHFDAITGIVHVASRCRYFSLKEAFEVKGSALLPRSKYVVEFSNGNMTAIRRAGCTSHSLHVEQYRTQKSVPLVKSVGETGSTEQVMPKVTNQLRSDVTHSEMQNAKVLSQHPSSPQHDHQSGLRPGSSRHNTSCLSTTDSSILSLGPVTSHTDIDRDCSVFVRNAAFSSLVRGILAGDVSTNDNSTARSRKPTTNNNHSRLESIASTATSRRSSSIFWSHQSLAELEGDPYTPLSSTFSDHSYGNGDNASKPPNGSHEHNSRKADPFVSNVMAGNGVSVNWAVVQALPSFTNNLDETSRCCDALQLMQPSLVSRPHSIEADQSLPHLDLAPRSAWKDLAHKMEKNSRFGLTDDEPFEIRLDDASGELYLPSYFTSSTTTSTESKGVDFVQEVSHEQAEFSTHPRGDTDINQAHARGDHLPQGSAEIEQIPEQDTPASDSDTPASGSILKVEDIDLDAEFPDQDGYDVTPYGEANVADIQTAAPLSAPTSNGGSESLDLRPRLLNETVDLLQEVNTNYCRIWAQGHPSVDYDCATYDPAIEQQAVQLFESKAGPMPIETRQVVNAFIKAFLKIWVEGNPPGKPGERWVTNKDEPYVSTVAVKMVEWGQMVFNSRQKRESLRLRPGSMVFEESPSSWEWYASRLGGDSQYREHRRCEVEESANIGQASERAPVHHINFNAYPVYERSYTPPEVSFWAAATTYDKVLLRKKLPCVHYARIITSQAFRWVDPTKYLGNDINALWQMTGSSMRNAATSDVQVVYQAVGTWNRDRFTEEDHIPEVAPADHDYEFASNGNYNRPQLPYLFDMQHDENRMFNINEGRPFEYRYCRSVEYKRDRPCLLRHEVRAQSPSSDEDSATNDEVDASEAETDNQDSVDPNHEPNDPVNSNEVPQSEGSRLPNASDDGQAFQSYEEVVSNVEDVQAFDEDAENSDAEAEVPMEPQEGVHEDEQSQIDSDDEGRRESTPELSTPNLQLSLENNLPPTTPESEAESVEVTSASMFAESMALMDRIKANRLNRPRRAISVESEDEVSFVESEKESFDGDNGITDHNSPWPTTPEPAEHRNADLIARFTEDPNLANRGDFEQSGTDAAEVEAATWDDGREIQSPIESNVSAPSTEPMRGERHMSSSNVLPSALREANTPPQSPSRADDDGSLLSPYRYPSVLSPIREEPSSSESSPVPRASNRPSRIIASPHQSPSSPVPIAGAEREARLARYAERPQERSGMQLILWQGRSQAHIAFPGSLMPRTFSTARTPAITGIGIVRRVLACSAHLTGYAERPQQRSELDLVCREGLSFLGSPMRQTFAAAQMPAITGMGIMQKVLACSVIR